MFNRLLADSTNYRKPERGEKIHTGNLSPAMQGSPARRNGDSGDASKDGASRSGLRKGKARPSCASPNSSSQLSGCRRA